MVRHLQTLGIDLDGFSLDGIDPISVSASETEEWLYGRSDRAFELAPPF